MHYPDNNPENADYLYSDAKPHICKNINVIDIFKAYHKIILSLQLTHGLSLRSVFQPRFEPSGYLLSQIPLSSH